MTYRFVIVAACTAFVAIALAACGGSSDSTSSSGKPAAQAKRSAADEVSVDRADKPAAPRRHDRPAPSSGEGKEAAGPGDSKAGAQDEPALPPAARREVALVRDLIFELVDGLNARDRSICTRLFSQHLVKRKDRPPLVERCERGTAGGQSEVELHQIEAIDIRSDGDAQGPLVQFVLEVERRQVRYLFRLTRSGGAYRIDVSLPVEQPK